METTIPRGIPSVTYLGIANVAQGVTNDLVVDGNVVGVNEPGQPVARFEVAQVLDRGLSDEDLCELTIGSRAGMGMGASLNPIAAFVQDAATAVIFFVGSKQSKKWKVLKKTFLPFVANEVFSFLIDKEQQSLVTTGSHEYYQKQLSFSAFEIQDEVIFDLQKPELKGLSIAMTPEEGYQVQGLHENFSVNDEVSLRRALFESCENRVSGYAQPVGSSIDTSTTVWELKLLQRELSVGRESSPVICKSRLLIIDVPSVDSLIEANMSNTGYYSLRQLQTTTLHRSLACFVEVNRRLSNPKLVLTAPFNKSLFTSYLSELLGGNSIVIGIGLVNPGEPLISKLTLELMQLLTRSQHYPISGKETTLLLQGLLSKYRALILQIQDELLRGPKPLTEADVGENKDLKIVELQKEIASLLLEKTNLISDNNGLFSMMELLKAKYNNILQEKNVQNDELAQSEEQKLALARALMELKLEHSLLEETLEKINYNNARGFIESKNDIKTLQGTCNVLQEERNANLQTIEELKGLLTQEQMTTSGLRSALAEVKLSLKSENDRVIELGAEVITLFNQKEFLQKKCTEIQNILDANNVKNQKANFQTEKLEESIHTLKLELDAREDIIKQLKHQLNVSEIDIKTAKLELDQRSQDIERMISDFNREKDMLMNEFQKERSLLEESFASSKGLNVEYKILALKDLEIKKKENTINDLHNEISRLNENFDVQNRNNLKLKDENDNLRGMLRKALSKALISQDDQDLLLMPILGQEESSGDPASNPMMMPLQQRGINKAVHNATGMTSSRKGDPIPQIPLTKRGGGGGTDRPEEDVSGIKISEEDVYKELVGTYVDRETRLLDSVDQLTIDNNDLKSHLRLLINNYITVIRFLSDGLAGNASMSTSGGANPAFDSSYIERWSQFFELQEKKLNDELILGKKAIEATGGLVKNSEMLQQNVATNQIRAIQSDIIAENEKYNVIVRSYKNSLKQSEMRVAEQKNEIIDLKLQIKRMLENPQMFAPVAPAAPTPSKEKSGGGGGENSSIVSNTSFTNDLYVTKKESEQQIKLLQDQLTGKLKDILRDSRESAIPSMLSIDERALLRRPTSRGLIAGINGNSAPAVVAEATGINTVSSAAGGVKTNTTGLAINDLGKINREVMDYVRKLEMNANEAVLYQLRLCEETLIELKSKNLFLTEQLSSYQAHMKKASLQYKKQLLVLQDKLIRTVQQQQQQQQHSRSDSKDLEVVDFNDDPLRLPSIAK